MTNIIDMPDTKALLNQEREVEAWLEKELATISAKLEFTRRNIDRLKSQICTEIMEASRAERAARDAKRTVQP